jgi:hypothetical protein
MKLNSKKTISDKELDNLDLDYNENSDNEDNFEDNDMSFDGFGGSSESPMEKHGDLFKTLTNFDKHLQKQVAEWLGMYWSEKEQKYVQDKTIKPIMNVQCARWCVNLIRTYARDNNLITQLDKQNYDFIYSDILDTVYLNLFTRADEDFGIPEDGDLVFLANQITHTAILVLIGAGGTNNYKKMFTETTSRNESVSLNENPIAQQKNSGGFLSRTRKLLGW